MKRKCTRCSEVKPWSEFYAARKWPDGSMRSPQTRCKACHRLIVREREATPEGRRAHNVRSARAFARRMADPDRAEAQRAYWRLYQRDHKRRQGKANRPELWLENRMPPPPLQDAAPLRVLLDGQPLSEIAAQSGVTVRTLRAVRSGERSKVSTATIAAVTRALDVVPAEVGL